MRSSLLSLFVILTIGLATTSVAAPAGAQGACGTPVPALGPMTDFVKNGCYEKADTLSAWTADPDRRLSSRYIDENPAAMAHHFMKVHYSSSMAAWLKANRNREAIQDDAAIPEGATMVAEVFASEGDEKPMEILSMVRSSGNWFFGRYLPNAADGTAKVSGGISYSACRGCHAFAGKSMIYGNYANIEGAAWRTSLTKAAPPPNNGVNDPAPVFQRGDNLSTPLTNTADIQAFLDFYSQYTNQPVPLLSSDDIVAFPPQSLDQVHPADGGTPQSDTYPITCDNAECFITSDYCQGCHDSTFDTTGNVPDPLPQMSYLSEDGNLYANWSMYGEWSASIMGLASRDPVWQGQIETEVNYNSGVEAAVIQDVCFSCHGLMGKRQKEDDLGEIFDLFNFFSVIPGNGYTNPYPGEAGSQPEFAEYGSLARDGVSCETCHLISPEGGIGQWDGTDYSVFYGPRDESVPLREDPPGPPYRFTALQQVDHTQVLGPDPQDTLNLTPMFSNEPVGINQALDQASGETYLRSSVVCATCHVLTVPKIPTDYVADGLIAEAEEHPYYTRPESCPPETTTWAADGNPVTDPCVALSYEQATYFEWLNSQFPNDGEATTCQGCHMPLANNPTNASGEEHKTIVAQFEDDTTTKKQFRRHRLLGINLFVHEMYQQFYELLGVTVEDSSVPTNAQFVKHNLLNAEQSIVDHATSQSFGNDGGSTAPVSIESFTNNGTELVVQVKVTNNSGHKFPTGAGFRRGFLRFEVLDLNGEVIWVSGQPNKYGAICNGACNTAGSNVLPGEFSTNAADLQPHYETITQQDQVQIYQVAEVDDLGILTSRTLSLFHGVKDNRILPSGWIPESDCATEPDRLGINICTISAITEPECDADFLDCDALDSDPYYHDQSLTGADMVTYQIPLSDIPSPPAMVRVSMLYQTIPPGYLVARYNDGYQNGAYGDATKRVIYMTSHLNLDLGLRSSNTTGPQFEIIQDNWSMMLSVDESAVMSDPDPTACVASDTVLCIDDQAGDGRFKVTMTYDTALGGGQSGDAQAMSLDTLGVTQGGVFNFFREKNPEALVKVLNFCELNGHYWVFHAAATNLGFVITVEDTQSGLTKTYTNDDQTQAEPMIDFEAFETCR